MSDQIRRNDMTAAERLDQIEARWAAWHDDEPYSERQWEELDDAYTAARTVHTDVAMAWEITREDVPALVAALRAVLELHRETIEWVAEDGSWYFSGCEQECTDAEGFSDYPCPTVRAIEEALSS